MTTRLMRITEAPSNPAPAVSDFVDRYLGEHDYQVVQSHPMADPALVGLATDVLIRLGIRLGEKLTETFYEKAKDRIWSKKNIRRIEEEWDKKVWTIQGAPAVIDLADIKPAFTVRKPWILNLTNLTLRYNPPLLGSLEEESGGSIIFKGVTFQPASGRSSDPHHFPVGEPIMIGGPEMDKNWEEARELRKARILVDRANRRAVDR
jgi:hypothetical protein